MCGIVAQERIAGNGRTWEFYPGILLKSLSSNYMAFPPAAGTLTLYLTVRAGCVK